MAGKKDQTVVAVITKLTKNQAAGAARDILAAKSRNAPLARVTVITGHEKDVALNIAKGHKEIQKKEAR